MSMQESTNADLLGLAKEVLKKYPVNPREYKLIQGKGIKTVWKVTTAEGVFCLKRLKQPFEKAVFSIGAQNHIVQRGGLVPGILSGSEGYITRFGDHFFVMYQWISGESIRMSHDDVGMAIQGLAGFHLSSEGYVPPEGCQVSSKLGRCPHQYEAMLQRIEDWSATAKDASRSAGLEIFRENAPRFIQRGLQAIRALEELGYYELASDEAKNPRLCHQDYGPGNALISSQGTYVLDLDNVTFDFVARDLRKILNKWAVSGDTWNALQGSELLAHYTSVVPLNDEIRRLLSIDLFFPHLFHDAAKKHFLKGKPLKVADMVQAVRIELSKPVL